jgi:hypothetical protein
MLVASTGGDMARNETEPDVEVMGAEGAGDPTEPQPVPPEEAAQD